MKKLIRSFQYAFAGVSYVAKHERSFRVQVLISIIVLVLACLFQIALWQVFVLIFLISYVLVLEIINSIFERIVDVLKPRIHPYAEAIKNMMAGTVLIASITSAIIGFFIFIPYFLGYIGC